MAYIINNYQPVVCTILSSQPLFFMDYEGDDADEIRDFTAQSPAFSAKDGGGESAGRHETGAAVPADQFVAALRGAFKTPAVSHEADSHEAGRDSQPFTTGDLAAVLKKSRLCAAFLEFAESHGTQFVYSDQVDLALYDRAAGNIKINPALDRDDKILLACRELRRAWQHRQGALLNPASFHPDHAVLVNRAQLADLCAGMIRMAWELNLAGETDLWTRLEESSLSDLARSFLRETQSDFRNLENGTAASAVFEAWFLSNRCQQEDRTLIQNMLADTNEHLFSTAEASRKVAQELLAALGGMPTGKNYLTPYVSTVMNDTLFTDVRDRANANFLWFIKFERCYRETERDLQQDGSHGDGDRRHGIHSKNGKTGDDARTAQIIPLSRNKDDQAGSAERARAEIGGEIGTGRDKLPGDVILWPSA